MYIRTQAALAVGVSDCINTHTGQCYHLATVFKDMCSTVGITNNYAATPSHVWNYVTLNGITYTFDPTAQIAWR